jgi:hypothetical protein
VGALKEEAIHHETEFKTIASLDLLTEDTIRVLIGLRY